MSPSAATRMAIPIHPYPVRENRRWRRNSMTSTAAVMQVMAIPRAVIVPYYREGAPRLRTSPIKASTRYYFGYLSDLRVLCGERVSQRSQAAVIGLTDGRYKGSHNGWLPAACLVAPGTFETRPGC